MSSEAAERLAARLAATPTPLAILQEQAALHGDHPALVFMRHPDDGDPQVMTYAALAEATARAAGRLQALGVGPDDGVGLLIPATPLGAAALFGAMSVGVAFPLNLLLTPDGMASQLRLARARIALVWGGTDAAQRLDAEAAGVDAVIDVADGTWCDGAPQAAFAGAASRVAALFHTGGTTGAPKLAQLSARGIAAAALMGGAALRLSPDDRIGLALPLFHVGGAISCLLSAMASGSTIVFPGLLGGRDPALRTGIWRLLERTGATLLGMVPTSLAGVVGTPVDGADLSRLRGVITGAAPLPHDVQTRLESLLGAPVSQLYGMTELSGVCSAQPCDGLFRPSGVGFLAPLMEAQLGGGSPAPGARGPLRLRGPNSFLGYRTPDGPAGAPADGWVDTGDTAEILPDGQLRLVGRSKDVIIRGGHNIDPLLIEEAAQQHPAVRVSAAAPLPDAYAGELPVLYVALHAGCDADPEEIAAFVAARIDDPPARPKRVFILPDLPLTPVGKIARFRLRQAAAIQAVRDAIGDERLELSCDDEAAKRLSYRWPKASAEDESALAAVAARLGLDVSG